MPPGILGKIAKRVLDAVDIDLLKPRISCERQLAALAEHQHAVAFDRIPKFQDHRNAAAFVGDDGATGILADLVKLDVLDGEPHAEHARIRDPTRSFGLPLPLGLRTRNEARCSGAAAAASASASAATPAAAAALGWLPRTPADVAVVVVVAVAQPPRA